MPSLGWDNCERLGFLGPHPINGRFNRGGTVFDLLIDEHIYLIIEYLPYRCHQCQHVHSWQPRLTACPRCRRAMPNARHICWDSVSDTLVMALRSWMADREDEEDEEGAALFVWTCDLQVDEDAPVWTAIEVD